MQGFRRSTCVLLLYCAVVMVTGCARSRPNGDEFDLFDPQVIPAGIQSLADQVTGHDEVPYTSMDAAEQVWDDDNLRLRRQTHHSQTANAYDSHLRIFRKTDSDSDGFITLDEYRLNNPTMTNEDVQIVMEVYDKNGDKKVSQTEFLSEGNAASHSVGCDVMALHQCGVSFIKAVRLTSDDAEGACLALQVYVDCVSRHLIRNACESESFTMAVLDIVTSFQEENICSSVDATGLETLLRSELRSRERRAVIPKTGVSCGKVSIVSCDVDFLRMVRQGEDPCDSLLGYRRCIHKGTRMCHDPTTSTLRDAIKKIAKSYRKAGLCEQK